MLKGTNPIWLNRLRHFHQRFDDSITCEKKKLLSSQQTVEYTLYFVNIYIQSVSTDSGNIHDVKSSVDAHEYVFGLMDSITV